MSVGAATPSGSVNTLWMGKATTRQVEDSSTPFIFIYSAFPPLIVVHVVQEVRGALAPSAGL
ncbi:hypothetical protein J2129_001312 [Methanofollis sp. W23]|nr:hypothetical protein [Methanofollis sp. W23]